MKSPDSIVFKVYITFIPQFVSIWFYHRNGAWSHLDYAPFYLVCPWGITATLIRVDNAYEAVAKLLALYEMSKPKKKGIDSLAYIAPTAQIDEDCYIAPFAYIGENVHIGKGTQI